MSSSTVREEGVLDLEDAVRKMTSMPAQRFGIQDRGILRPGMWADIVVFNPDIVIDKATYQDPHQFPEGIDYVLINGKVVVDEGEYKPYEETEKAEFDKDEEEEEPEGGILGIHDKHPYKGKKSDKFMTDVLSLTTMKPIKKTKPIKKSKPLTSLAGEGKPLGLEKPHVAGLLPPKSEDQNSTQTDTTPPAGQREY